MFSCECSINHRSSVCEQLSRPPWSHLALCSQGRLLRYQSMLSIDSCIDIPTVPTTSCVKLAPVRAKKAQHRSPTSMPKVGSLPLGESVTSKYIPRRVCGLGAGIRCRHCRRRDDNRKIFSPSECLTGCIKPEESSDKDLGHSIKAHRSDVA